MHERLGLESMGRLFAVVLFSFCWIWPARATLIFEDGFESPSAPDCVSGVGPDRLIDGDLGPAGSGFELIGCLEVANDRSFGRTAIAYSSIPVQRSRNLQPSDFPRLAIIGPGNRLIASQFDVVSRWGGPLADGSRPIRWLQISLDARADANSLSRYSLVLYPTPPQATDDFAASITPVSSQFVVDTGVGRFTLDPANPALFDSIEVDANEDRVGLQTIYSHAPGAGPFLTHGANVTIDTGGNGAAVVDPSGFTIVESGPVKVVVRLNGHLTDPGGSSLCNATAPPYEQFGYTLVATFHRGRRDILMQYQFRNECSGADGEPWDDEVVFVTEAGWRFPLSLGLPTVHRAGAGNITSAVFTGTTQIRQRRGGGMPWQRRADVRVNGAEQEAAEFFPAPFLGLSDATFLVTLQMPWMRFREPQALTLIDRTLSFDVITESLVVGEGKGIWNFALLGIQPAARIADIESLRETGLADLERGLLPRADRDSLAASGVLPPLGNDSSSGLKTGYRDFLVDIHANTVSKQWAAAKTYGTQLWPDVQFDEQFGSTTNATPAENNPPLNYWNPSGAELLEFLRSGEPMWVWDFALPQSWLQTFAAYLNVFDKRHGRSNGAAVNSGGSGEGNWHRNAFGSDDYTYNRGMALAYVLRPSSAMRQRFGHAGQMVIDRYNLPRAQEASRDFFLGRVSPERGILQHFENLANCAEFVPGALGQACHAKLVELLDELSLDNLRAGMICQGDIPLATECQWPQTFMINAMQYLFFLRMHLNYADVLDPATAGPLLRMLREMPGIYYDLGMNPVGQSPSAFSEWGALLTCAISADSPTNCQRFDTGDGVDIIFQNRPHTLSLGMLAHWLDPSTDLCAVSKQLLDTQFDGSLPNGPLSDYLGQDSGWFKGAAQVVQQLVYAVGLYDSDCQ